MALDTLDQTKVVHRLIGLSRVLRRSSRRTRSSWQLLRQMSLEAIRKRTGGFSLISTPSTTCSTVSVHNKHGSQLLYSKRTLNSQFICTATLTRNARLC
ncbi:hypothetical protein HYQ46_003219 [Verticillium longisporum]|nr:hypothetical protein HYQ46_003219 [Verticillium longisporum]